MDSTKRLIDTYFTTATILNWYPLFEDDTFKDIIIDSFSFTVKNKRASIFAFVIMSNHFHVVWQILPPYELNRVRQNLLKFTSQHFKFLLSNNFLNKYDLYKTEIKTSDILDQFRVDKIDRKHQFWKRNPLSVEILSEKVLNQKINYIHNNLARKNLNDVSYKYSSAYYYETGLKNWDFLL
ncbi:MAG: hypothetical protein V9E90_13215 [Saprospiraceae bacterium]|jgi:REP element-mobilizing transposase RayT